jgi:hypothetical protein
MQQKLHFGQIRGDLMIVTQRTRLDISISLNETNRDSYILGLWIGL